MATGLFNLKQVNQAISQGAWSGYIAPRWVEYLVVAGGGGGGTTGGGGGAGGLLTGVVTVAAGASYSVTVGTGGAGATSYLSTGTSGVASVFGSISTTGGGGGGSNSPVSGLSGGSGGGAGSSGFLGTGGQGVTGQGNSGSFNSTSASNYGAGGGGGAGTVGLNGLSSAGGNGGAGIASAVTGTVVTYAGGGGAGSQGGTAGVGGVGGGGGGTNSVSTAASGSANTGGGGGGGGYSSNYGNGGNGGSGIVVVRYPGNVQFYTGGTVTYSNGYIVHNFIANGTLAPTTPTVVSEYQISRSLRFNSADSTYLNRTPATATNRKTFTWSGWVKRSQLGAFQRILEAGSSTADRTVIGFDNTDKLEFFNYISGTLSLLTTTQVFRDPSAWYHIVVAMDTTQATSSNRTKIYVNGVQITSFVTSDYVGQNVDTYVNSAIIHRIGASQSIGDLLNGYQTEVNLIDGQQLTPTSFGYVNPATGIWSPAKFVGGYGTNGFYVNFSDNSNTTAATLGADYSGNGNNWTPNGFSVSSGAGNDSLVDSPTSYGTDTGVGGTVRGNYATFNPLVKVDSQPTLSNGNLLSTAPAGWSAAVGTIGLTSGKWYWEIVNGNSDAFVGICGDNATLGTVAPQSSTGTILYYGNTGNKRIDTVDTAYGSAFSTQTIGVALDIDGGTIVFYRDNVSQGSISISSSTLNGKTIFPLSNVISTTATVNFGQRPFEYTAPSGFKALCTQNLPTPTVGATSATLANKYYDASLYTGNGSNSQVISNSGFQPDWVWIKARSNAQGSSLVDSVRGPSKILISNSTSAELTATNPITFNPTGFTSTTDVSTNAYTYVAWQWRASNATAVTNTSGSITSTVSANTTSGFSVVTYTGTGANATVGHGLGVAPSMLIIKRRDSTSNWLVYQISLGNTKGLVLNATQAESTDSTYWNNTSPTSSVFSLGSGGAANASSGTMVAYCFAAIAGYSAFGSYTGNGSTDGTFVFTGFRPAYVMIKSSSATTDWIVYDAVRNTYNVTDLNLRPNTSDAESSQAANYIDLLSNGFKLRGDGSGSINASGATYIYMAFATSPFKYSLAR
jgi:hypothetical protein